MDKFIIYFISYFIGNISPSYIFTKFLKNEDIRDFGSGNAGTTNALRVGGKKMGLAVFLVDFFKGFLVALLVNKNFGLMTALMASICVILGHIYPVFLKFRGGKGVATSLGVYYALFFVPIFICSIIGLILLYIKRYVSLSAMVTLFNINIAMFIAGYEIKYILCTIFIFLLVTYKHKSNIQRLMNHNENKLSFSKK
ncbi:glycerol-3-phosphate 1-O-acyltransferase PlsY [Criibacterium bergeronii]|uniref:Glycerol-3-phosphate acyltransferase n=1 Tax=Criibacterium bergeronii TaxID=1871336 RepID=A0A371IJM8_9FIRM|nr:glycerol-3-phosphate 1-O-acyltransferase PlsY [Criibacterium bergeronii]RDY20676.1 glycerol-3-phosphate 1-O-acyltransferase [Criibacterium bergeronii]TRW28305.1 glycerol-3-phosphate 1-O-acyltransferase PlsY [Criibacterium bergeronii]